MPHPLAGQPAPASSLVDVDNLIARYYAAPDPTDPEQLVSFGTSGHRGSSLRGSFNEAHILAITQAICEYRKKEGITGPLFLGKDTHALSLPAEQTALSVLIANGVETVVEGGGGFTPTPALSRAILAHNKGRTDGARLADGIVVTPSHNPPDDGGFKYNPPNGGPADTGVTGWIQDRANVLLREGTAIRRLSDVEALSSAQQADLLEAYVGSLTEAIDIDVIRNARVRCAVDPLGGASVAYWQAIAARLDLDIDVVNPVVDPRFAFMTLDHDGKIRMDCSSPYAMAKLVALGGKYQVAFGNDADADRHGIVVPSVGLLNPNHYLAVAIRYLFTHRPKWPAAAAVGKTLVSSALIDRVAKEVGRPLKEVPVGFKWFVSGLLDGSLGFGGEESAGASFLRRDGGVWTTDKDGMLLALLAAEITGRTGKDPGEHHREIVEKHGAPTYARMDEPATTAEKARLGRLSPSDVKGRTLAGEPITDILTKAPGNGAAIGGLKIVASSGWFAARPSGTENIYKIYAESFRGREHLNQVIEEARAMVKAALAS